MFVLYYFPRLAGLGADFAIEWMVHVYLTLSTLPVVGRDKNQNSLMLSAR